MTRMVAFILLAVATAAFAEDPSSTNNADSCDVAVAPAATLLLPYFEVDTASLPGEGATTLFTVTNASRYPQIARVTLWTDWAFPVLDFHVLLTGYDVQAVNLYDVIVRGVLTANPAPFENTANPNFATGELTVQKTCAALPRTIPPVLLAAARSALTVGTGYDIGSVKCSGPLGSNHGTQAHGYVTVDVVSHCSSKLVVDGSYYYGTAAPILFDNVLLGDYQQIGPMTSGFQFNSVTSIDAQGSPMVHIRAVPEGGLSGASGGQFVETSLPYTFYDRYTPTAVRTADRRQPLPSMWAARFIEGGTGFFATELKIWREGVTRGLPTCTNIGTVQRNSVIAVTHLIRFDEHENANGRGSALICSACPYYNATLPAASRTANTSSTFPSLLSTDLGGWMFLNLSSGTQHVNDFGSLVLNPVLSAQRAGFGPDPPGTSGSRTTTQNWVNIFMFGAIGAHRLSVDYAAAWLGNGCTPADSNGAYIAPANQRGGPLVCPNNTGVSNCGTGTKPPGVNP